MTNRSNTHFQGIKSVSSIRSASTGPQGLVMLNRNVLSSQGLNSALHSTDGAERSIEGIVRELDRQSECLNQSKVEEEAASRLIQIDNKKYFFKPYKRQPIVVPQEAKSQGVFWNLDASCQNTIENSTQKH